MNTVDKGQISIKKIFKFVLFILAFFLFFIIKSYLEGVTETHVVETINGWFSWKK